jgi:hypothetical protein
LFQIGGADGPEFAWPPTHPHTGATWANTSGGNAFREFAVAFSVSFKQTYVSLNQANWTVTANGYNAAGAWADFGSSSVIGDPSMQGVTANVQVLGLPLVDTFGLVYAP